MKTGIEAIYRKFVEMGSTESPINYDYADKWFENHFKTYVKPDMLPIDIWNDIEQDFWEAIIETYENAFELGFETAKNFLITGNI